MRQCDKSKFKIGKDASQVLTNEKDGEVETIQFNSVQGFEP